MDKDIRNEMENTFMLEKKNTSSGKKNVQKELTMKY